MTTSSTTAHLAVLVITPMVTGSVSFTASLVLVIMILRSNLRLGTVYRRLVFMVSLFDIIQSLSQALSSVPMPAGSFWGAVGNRVTCDIQGLMTVIGVTGAALYSLSLSIYFVAVIKFNMPERIIKYRLEPFLHSFPILYCIVGGVALYVTGSLNPAGPICWIGPDLSRCDNDEECIKRMGNIYIYLQLVFSGGLVIFVFLSNCVAMSLIYWAEYAQSQRNQFYQTSWMQNQNLTNRHVNTDHVSPLAERLSRPSRASIQRRKEISNRAIAFIVGYLLTYTPPFLYRCWDGFTSDGAPFALTLFSRFFFPLQGLLNIIIYTYPHVVSRYNANDEYSWIRAFWEVVKSGGDKDHHRGRRQGARLAGGRVRLQSDTPLRRNSIRNEPVVTDINEILDLHGGSEQLENKREAITSNLEEV